MHPRNPQNPALLVIALLIIGVAWPLSTQVEAKGKKGKSASRSKSSKKSSAKNRKRRSKKGAEDNIASIPAVYPIAPDRIEVIENGADSSPDVSRHLNLPVPRAQSSQPPSEPDLSAPKKRKNVNIGESRVLQIQQALKQRGFYNDELTGVYDNDTVEAMRRFQIDQKINATGYPTAHALKRLGLTNW
ncbi:MAG TPA: peptidoglycan-binding domain-containing protein [Blastocatellia bacterium]|nr:peptidoglycan-binding domain-containing protein [Blastocatellia bacterium]